VPEALLELHAISFIEVARLIDELCSRQQQQQQQQQQSSRAGARRLLAASGAHLVRYGAV